MQMSNWTTQVLGMPSGVPSDSPYVIVLALVHHHMYTLDPPLLPFLPQHQLHLNSSINPR